MPAASASAPARSRSPHWWLATAAALLVAGVARGAALVPGDILVTDQATDTLYRIDPVCDPGCDPPIALASAGFLADPIGVAVRGDGFAFVTNIGNNLIIRVDAAPGPLAPVQIPISSLTNPRGIVIDAESSDAFVSSPTLDQILRIDTVTGTGNPFASSGAIHFPTGLVQEPSGDLVVADSSSFPIFGSKVVRLNREDGAQTILASAGFFQVLRDIEIDPSTGHFLVVDSGARKIFEIDPNEYDFEHPEANQSDWAACPEFVSPRGIAVESHAVGDAVVLDSVLVSDFGAQKIFRIYPTGDPRECIALQTGSALVGPWDVTVVGALTSFDPTPLLVADAGTDLVLRVDPGEGTGGTSVPLTAAGALTDPVAVTRDLDGNLLVLQPDRISRVTTGGTQTLVAIITSDPSTELPVALAGIVVQKNGEILVSDTANDRLLRVIPGTGQQFVVADDDDDPPALLARPAGLAIDRNGTVLVANRGRPEQTPAIPTGLARVNPSSGTTSATLNDAAFGELVAIALDRNGDYLIGDVGTHTVWRLLASTPGAVDLFAVSAGIQITSLRGLAVDADRSILVSNQGTAKLLRLDPTSGEQSVVAPDVPFTDIQGIALDQIPSPPDLDSDFDGILEDVDNCPEVLNPDQKDSDLDGLGDFCDDDDDNDGDLDAADNCRLVANPDQIDTNLDGFGNLCDPDYNNDGVVGGADFIQFSNAFGKATGETGYNADIDANSDGGIGAMDFVVFASFFGRPPGP